MSATKTTWSVAFLTNDNSGDIDDTVDFDTLEEARAYFEAGDFPGYARGSLDVELMAYDSGTVIQTRKNPGYVEERDDDWRRERAMEAGMAFGCDAYNEEMGWSLESPDDY